MKTSEELEQTIERLAQHLERSCETVFDIIDKMPDDSQSIKQAIIDALLNHKNSLNEAVDEIYNDIEIVEELEEKLDCLELNSIEQLTDFLPPSLQTLRYKMALEKLFLNIEHINIEDLERLAEPTMTQSAFAH